VFADEQRAATKVAEAEAVLNRPAVDLLAGAMGAKNKRTKAHQVLPSYVSSDTPTDRAAAAESLKWLLSAAGRSDGGATKASADLLAELEEAGVRTAFPELFTAADGAGVAAAAAAASADRAQVRLEQLLAKASSSIIESSAHWHRELLDLIALMGVWGVPTFFHTITAAENLLLTRRRVGCHQRRPTATRTTMLLIPSTTSSVH
jgi:hypothetical protein